VTNARGLRDGALQAAGRVVEDERFGVRFRRAGSRHEQSHKDDGDHWTLHASLAWRGRDLRALIPDVMGSSAAVLGVGRHRPMHNSDYCLMNREPSILHACGIAAVESSHSTSNLRQSPVRLMATNSNVSPG